jgi:membrane protease YdiL (CAAX protease family)
MKSWLNWTWKIGIVILALLAVSNHWRSGFGLAAIAYVAFGLIFAGAGAIRKRKSATYNK